MTKAFDRKKVFFIINSMTGGGAERVMSTLLHNSTNRFDDLDLRLVLLDEEEVSYDPPEGVTVHRLNCEFRTDRSLLRLRALIRQERPDLTLSFLTRANIANAFAMHGSGRPWVISERINTSVQLGRGAKSSIGKFLVRISYPRATRIIAVSQGVADELVESFSVPSTKTVVISNPVDFDKIRQQAAAQPSVAMSEPYTMAMGRLVPQKNFHLLIRAFAESEIEGSLLIAGEGPLRGELEKLSADLGIADRVFLPGFIANPYALLARAETFALSSDYEGSPNALLEALALGLPAIATNCPDGPAEILAESRRKDVSGLTVAPSGILAPVGDVGAFAEGLRLLRDSGLRQEVTKNAEKRIQSFSVARSTDRYWTILTEALTGTVVPAAEAA